MKQSKPTHEDVEMFHDEGNYVIICLPEYLSNIRNKLSASSIPHSEPETVVSQRQLNGNTLSTVGLHMNELRLPHSDIVLEWFRMNQNSFERDPQEF